MAIYTIWPDGKGRAAWSGSKWLLLDVTDGLKAGVVLLRGTREECLREELRRRSRNDAVVSATLVEPDPAKGDCACKGQITNGEHGRTTCTNLGDGPLAQVERAAAAPGSARSVVERSASGRKRVVGGHGSVGRPTRWPPIDADAEAPHSDADPGL